MTPKSEVQDLVYRAIDRANELLLKESAIPKDLGTILLGEGACLDSMGFVNFVVALEEEYASSRGGGLNLVERLNSAIGKAARISTVAELIDFLALQEDESQPS